MASRRSRRTAPGPLAEAEPTAPDPSPARHERGAVVRGLRFSTIAYPLNLGLLFASQVLAARLLTRSEFGTYSLAVSIFMTGALVMQLGLPHSLLRRASAALQRGDAVEARHEIISAFFAAAVVALLTGAFIASPLGEDLLSSAFPETAVAAVAVVLGVRTGLKVIENTVPEILRAFREFIRVQVYDGLLTNLVFVAVLLGALAAAAHPSVKDVLLMSTLVSAATLVPACLTAAMKLRETKDAGFSFRNPLEPGMWVVTMGRAVLAQLDLLVVGALGTSREVALYAAPFRLALLVGLPLIVVNQVIPPVIAGWYASGLLPRLERMMRGTAGIAVIAAATLAAILAAFGRPILTVLFGHGYGPGWTVLAILAAGQVAQTWTGSCGFALMMTGHQRVYATILVISTPLTIGFDVAMYHALGIEGVALATAVSLTVQNVVQMFVVRRVAGFSTLADLRAAVGEGRQLLDRVARRT